ncbi:selenoneine biosynthesis selenosugar synthase SenB [Accumulibacter sp.]|uniref:selenoneine biosynthesis selenosugar synthase SenB n=1 Tax=Accumulibacter sp. TaxID=2053492 RepID=UPI0025C0742B|nr:selenoneine biosynthesis selenosugar synthase SenB [Accumulibacter sp.]
MKEDRSQQLSQVVIVSPALAAANNGNWRTARRWQRFLSWPPRIIEQWPDEFSDRDRVMLALHARRSSPSIIAWREMRRSAGLAVILTGTDLYRDIGSDVGAQRSLHLADALVVLQERGPLALPGALHAKTRVIFQSTSRRKTLAKSQRRLRALMVGHLRAEKDPETLFAAARLLAGRDDIRIDHIGDPLEPRLGEAARATMAASASYRWLGGQPHAATRQRIQRADLLIQASRMEGGAHVVMEAVCSGTPVIASAIDGNIGMLGDAYAGYFCCGDAPGLVELLVRCRASQGRSDGLLARLADQCRERAALFAPAAERAAVRRLVADLIAIA